MHAFERAGEATPKKLDGIIADLLLDFRSAGASVLGDEDAGDSLFTLLRTLVDVEVCPAAAVAESFALNTFVSGTASQSSGARRSCS
jgi:hypothetical protein